MFSDTDKANGLGIELKLTNVNILKYFNYYQLLIIIEMLWRASK